MPDRLSWLDNRRLGYLAPPDPSRRSSELTYVVHDADTGEVLAARSGSDFKWDASHRHVAFLSGRSGQQALVVDGKNVWPRAGLTRLHGDPVWSSDGHGLAIVDDGGGSPRLVVMVEFDDPQGDLTWPVPRDALAPGLRVFWASESKVVIGESALQAEVRRRLGAAAVARRRPRCERRRALDGDLPSRRRVYDGACAPSWLAYCSYVARASHTAQADERPSARAST